MQGRNIPFLCRAKEVSPMKQADFTPLYKVKSYQVIREISKKLHFPKRNPPESSHSSASQITVMILPCKLPVTEHSTQFWNDVKKSTLNDDTGRFLDQGMSRRIRRRTIEWAVTINQSDANFTRKAKFNRRKTRLLSDFKRNSSRDTKPKSYEDSMQRQTPFRYTGNYVKKHFSEEEISGGCSMSSQSITDEESSECESIKHAELTKEIEYNDEPVQSKETVDIQDIVWPEPSKEIIDTQEIVRTKEAVEIVQPKHTRKIILSKGTHYNQTIGTPDPDKKTTWLRRHALCKRHPSKFLAKLDIDRDSSYSRPLSSIPPKNVQHPLQISIIESPGVKFLRTSSMLRRPIIKQGPLKSLLL